MKRQEKDSFRLSLLLILGCLMAFSLPAGGQSAADIHKAKEVLNEMGIAA